MARRDYICCKSCSCKLVYDGYDNIRCDLEAQYGTMDLICPDCLKELETKLAEREQEPAQSELLEVVLAMRDWIDAVPQDTQLPAMPGFDRDWANAVIEQAQQEPAQAVPAAWLDEEFMQAYTIAEMHIVTGKQIGRAHV